MIHLNTFGFPFDNISVLFLFNGCKIDVLEDSSDVKELSGDGVIGVVLVVVGLGELGLFAVELMGEILVETSEFLEF